MTLKKKIIYSIIYIIMLSIALEGLSRLVVSWDMVLDKVYANTDSFWRLQWIKRHKDEIDIYYEFDVYDPAKGWISKPDLRDVKVFNGKTLNTNSKGFRGKVDYSYDKNPDKKRVLIVGDSFTFGDEVSDDETYSYYLQEMFADAEIINMGVHGYGHDQMLILLKGEGIKYNPDIIIPGFIYEDTYRNSLKFRDYAKPKFELVNDKLELTNMPVPLPDEFLKWEWSKPKILDLFSIVSHRLIHNRYTAQWEMFDDKLTKRILDEIVAVSHSIDASPVFVYLPVREEITSTDDTTMGETYLRNYCKGNDQVECYSSRPHFTEKVKKGEEFEVIAHWRPLGHLTVAEAIRDYLIQAEKM